MGQLLVTALILLASAHAQTPNDPAHQRAVEHSIWSDLNCYINDDVKSCNAHVSSDASSESDRFYLEHGCEVLKSTDLCIRLGDWWAKRSIDQAKTIYLSFCHSGVAVACERGYNLTDQNLAANATPEQIAASSTQSNEFLTLACASKEKDSAAVCKRIKDRQNARSARVAGKACELRVQFVPDEGGDLFSKVIPGSFTDTSDCLQQCQHMMARIDLKAFEARGAHGACLKEHQIVGAPLWRFKGQTAECANQSSRNTVSTDDGVFHRPCFCEGDPPSEINRTLEGLGFFAIPFSGKQKRFGNETFAKCSLHLFRVDGWPASGPKCLDDLTKAKAQLKTVVRSNETDLQINPKICQDH